MNGLKEHKKKQEHALTRTDILILLRALVPCSIGTEIVGRVFKKMQVSLGASLHS